MSTTSLLGLILFGSVFGFIGGRIVLTRDATMRANEIKTVGNQSNFLDPARDEASGGFDQHDAKEIKWHI